MKLNNDFEKYFLIDPADINAIISRNKVKSDITMHIELQIIIAVRSSFIVEL